MWKLFRPKRSHSFNFFLHNFDTGIIYFEIAPILVTFHGEISRIWREEVPSAAIMSTDDLSQTSRSFYERSKTKLVASIVLGAACMMLLGFTSNSGEFWYQNTIGCNPRVPVNAFFMLLQISCVSVTFLPPYRT